MDDSQLSFSYIIHVSASSDLNSQEYKKASTYPVKSMQVEGTQMTDSQGSPLTMAKSKFDEQNYQECLRLLIFAFTQNSSNRDCYELAAACLRQMKADDEVKLFEAALAAFDDYRPFFDLGYHFVEAGHDRLAIPMLLRSFYLNPGNSDVGLELAIALCGRFQPDQAREVLLQCDLVSSFWVAYQYFWASMLCNIRDGAEQFIKESRRQFLAEAASHEVRGALYALDKLDEMRLRLQAIGAPKPLIRDWHFIQYGAAILDYFDDRDGQEGYKVAGGRWVYIGVSYQQLSITLTKLKRLMHILGREPRLVLSMPDRDSKIIAQAVANMFKLPLTVIADPANIAFEESLLVAANNLNLAGAQIERILKHQTVFSFNLDWLSQGPNTPDITGIMSQYCVFPWSKDRLVVEPGTNNRVSAPEDTRSPEEIAAEFSQEIDDMDPHFAEVLDFYKNYAPYLKGGRLGGGKRWRFITDSPVPGNYFC